MQPIVIIPFAIIVSTIVIFVILSKALSSYIGRMEAKAKTTQRISLLLIASDFVNLFSSSESKRMVDKIVLGSEENDDKIFASLSSSFGGAGIEIENLYNQITKAYKPSEDISRIKISALYLRSILLLYGLSVSITQLLFVAFFYPAGSSVFNPATSDMLVATILFSSIVVYISLYILYISRRIEMRYLKLQESRNSLQQGAE